MKKKFVLLSSIVMIFFLTGQAKAQVHVDVNIGTPVYVAPAPAAVVSYYYLPDVEAYYYIPTRTYYYNSGGHWIHARYLPGSYRHYNVSHFRHINVYESRPYLRHTYYQQRYHNDRHNYNSHSQHWDRGNHGHNGHSRGRR